MARQYADGMLADWIPGLATLSPEVVWGIFTRSIGLIFLISFLSLAPQVLPLASADGAVPIARRMDRMRKDFRAPKRFFYFPTLLWISSSDLMLRLLTIVGLLAACCVIYGGAVGPYAMALCYVCYLSLDLPVGLIFPWDCMLFEAVILGMFLPETHALPELAATATPAPALAWSYRLLLFRVMFGFGKNKFLGATKDDAGYLKGFLSAQPLPNMLGWYAQKAPMWMMRWLLIVMFVVEIPVPFLVFVPGDLSIVAAFATSLLMVGIIAFGSFGYFSLLTIACCLPLFDHSTPEQLVLGELFGAGAPNVTNAFVLMHTLGAVVVFPLNSWVGQSWSHWTLFQRLKPRVLAWPFALLRAMHPFRWLHPYGVFPPRTFPSAKGAVIVEVSWDGEAWSECNFRFFASNERSKPRFVAPHHPRGDQAVVYETFGLNPTTMVASLAGPFEPYGFGKQPAAAQLCQHIVEGRGGRYLESEALRSHAEPPKYARVRTVLLEPATIEQLRKQGKYWNRTVIGPHTPPHSHDPEFWRYMLPEPEMWHPDAWIWRRRSRLGELMRRAERGEDIHTLSLERSEVLCAEDRERFWSELVPLFSTEERASWRTLPNTVARYRAHFDRSAQYRMELLMGRYSAMLEARLQPLYLHSGLRPSRMPAKTYLHLWMLTHHVIGQGRDVYDRVCATPALAARYLDSMTVENGLYFLCVFRFETMIFDAQKLRLVRAVMGPYEGGGSELLPWQQRILDVMHRLWGYFDVAQVVMQHFEGRAYDRGYPERYPRFELIDGEVQLVGWRDNDSPPSGASSGERADEITDHQ